MASTNAPIMTNSETIKKKKNKSCSTIEFDIVCTPNDLDHIKEETLSGCDGNTKKKRKLSSAAEFDIVCTPDDADVMRKDTSNSSDGKKRKKRKHSKPEDRNDSSLLSVYEEVKIDNNCESPETIKKKKRKLHFVVDGGEVYTPPENNIKEDIEGSSKILSDIEFSSLKEKICHETLRAIEDLGFTKMTKIQKQSILPLLERRNLVATAKTGSGKTLAFLVPAIECVIKSQFTLEKGTECIIITPTRELAMQIHGVVEDLTKYHNISFGLIMGGVNRQNESKMLEKGIDILIATPGRLLDHLKYTPHFVFSNLKCLIIDEADRILDKGFEHDLEEIISILPKKRQTMLFSATNTKEVDDLRRLAVSEDLVFIEIEDTIQKSTVDGLVQGYFICPDDKKFLVLFKFLNLTHKKNRKVMVFFSSRRSVKFHDMIFNRTNLPVISIHGKMSQSIRSQTFFEFCSAKSGILFCTDIAARGLDIPSVDWIIQYDPPDGTKEYIHRVGRTARGEGGIGRAIIFLRPAETGYIKYLTEAKIPVEKLDFDFNKLIYNQDQFESTVHGHHDLKEAAKKAFKSCVRSYVAHHLKEVFDVRKLDLAKLAKTFGLAEQPEIELDINFRRLDKKMKKKKRKLGIS